MAADNTRINILDIFYPYYGFSLSLYFYFKTFFNSEKIPKQYKEFLQFSRINLYYSPFGEHVAPKNVYKYMRILETLFIMPEIGNDLNNQNRGFIT